MSEHETNPNEERNDKPSRNPVWMRRLRPLRHFWEVPGNFSGYLAQNWGWRGWIISFALMAILTTLYAMFSAKSGLLDLGLKTIIVAGLVINTLWLLALLWKELELEGRIVAGIVAFVIISTSILSGLDFQVIALISLIIMLTVAYFRVNFRNWAWPIKIMLVLMIFPGTLWELQYRHVLTAGMVHIRVTSPPLQNSDYCTWFACGARYEVNGINLDTGETVELEVVDSWWRADFRSGSRFACFEQGEEYMVAESGIRFGLQGLAWRENAERIWIKNDAGTWERCQIPGIFFGLFNI